MSTREDQEDKEGTISPLGLENLADLLSGYAEKYREAAKLMRDGGITEISVRGIPTAIRGIGYIQRNTKAVTSSIQPAELLLKEIAPELSDALVKELGGAIADSVQKQVNSKRKRPS